MFNSIASNATSEGKKHNLFIELLFPLKWRYSAIMDLLLEQLSKLTRQNERFCYEIGSYIFFFYTKQINLILLLFCKKRF